MNTGLTAIELTGQWYGNPGTARAHRYFSSDGLTWQRTATVGLTENPSPWTVIDQPLAPIRVNGQQGLVYQPAEGQLHLSTDGVTWQEIRLDREISGDSGFVRNGATLAVVGEEIFYYEYQKTDSAWQLHTWVLIPGTSSR